MIRHFMLRLREILDGIIKRKFEICGLLVGILSARRILRERGATVPIMAKVIS